MRKEQNMRAGPLLTIFGIVGLMIHGAALMAFSQGTAPTTKQSASTGLTTPGNAPRVPASADMISLNFSGADLVEVIHVLARHLRLNYTIDPEVKGVVTIFSGEPIKKEDLLPIFHELLRMNNAVAIKRGNLYRISGIKEGVGLAYPKRTANGFAMRIVPVRFFSVGEMKKLLTPFVSSGGEILEYSRGNFLIMVDLPSNIRRLLEIKDLIDVNVFTGTRMELYKPRVATAEELAEEMGKIMQSFAASTAQEEGFAAQFMPLPRINQLLVIAHSEAAWNYVKRWIEKIDVIAETPGRRIFIYPVENGKAVELASILNDIYSTGAINRGDSGPSLRQLHGLTPGGSGLTPGARGGQSSSGGASGRLFAAAETPSTRPAPRAQSRQTQRSRPRTSPRATQAPPTRAEEGIRVVAEPATNSLVIFATAQEYLNIRGVLQKLDLIPRQVLMEVLVAEVTLTDDFEFGVEYALQKGGFPDIGDVVPLAFPGTLLGSPGFIGGGGGFSAVFNAGNDFRVAIDALMQDSRVKVLSSPHLLAVDNQPARIQVGSEQPVATGTVTSQEASATTTTIQFKNIGRILTIIPQVNSEGLVNLQVKIEVSDVGERVLVGNQTFDAFNIRDAETTAVVQDSQTLVIGGIITENNRKSRSGVPYLMDIPFLGQLFRNTTDNADRTELVILITPRVIRNQQEADNVTDTFMNKVSTVKKQLETDWRSSNPLEGTTLSESSIAPTAVPAEPTTGPKSGPLQDIRSRAPEHIGNQGFALREIKFAASPKLRASNDPYPTSMGQGYQDGENNESVTAVKSTKDDVGFWRTLFRVITFGIAD